jgi:hypothetical protein
MDKNMALVEFETNKFIHNSYHHKKYINRYNMNRFMSLVNQSYFKEHKDFNEISNFFPLSPEILSKTISEELEETGDKKRLKVFFKDLDNAIKKIEHVLPKLDIVDLSSYMNQSKRYSLSTYDRDLPLARAAMQNFINEYKSIEREILEIIMQNLSSLVESNYRFLFGEHYQNLDENYNNVNEQKIKKYISLLYSTMLSKNITKKEIVDIFRKLMSDVEYWHCNFLCNYPHGLDYDSYEYSGHYHFDVYKYVENLSISDRFNKFIDLLSQEIECYYIFQILNTELYKLDEIIFGDITYYNEKVHKAKRWKTVKIHSDDDKEKFGNGKHVKAILQYKTKKHFSNVSFLEARKVVENNISLLKLFGNCNLKEKVKLFKPDVSPMDVSYSYYILDENYYMLGSSHTVYDGNFSFEKNIIYDEFFEDKIYEEQLNVFIKQINHKQKGNYLTQTDLLILQVLSKYKKSVESSNFTDVLLNTWNAFEFLTKAFNVSNSQNLTNLQKIEKVVDFIELIYSFVYMNEHHKWDLTNSKAKRIVKSRSNRLVTYAYFYRNQIVHGHLVENPFMISVTRGLNIFLANLLGLIMEKIVFMPDYSMDNIFKQLQSDLEKRTKDNLKKDTHEKNF